MSYLKPLVKRRELKSELRDDPMANGYPYSDSNAIHRSKQAWAEENMSQLGIARYRARQLVRVATVSLAASGVVANWPIAIRGSLGELRTTAQIDQTITERSRDVLSHRSLSDRYKVQYISPISTKTRVRRSGKGILGLLQSSYDDLTIGESCLAGTPYDTTPASITIEGDAYGGGDLPAAAAVNYSAPTKVVSIVPSVSQAAALNFVVNSQNRHLEPADESTRETLVVNNCTLGHAAYLSIGRDQHRRILFQTAGV